MIKKYIDILYVSASKFSIKIKGDGNPYEIAFWLMSIFFGYSIVIFLGALDSIFVLNLTRNPMLYSFGAFGASLLLSYYLFLFKNKYKKIVKEHSEVKYHVFVISFITLSIIFVIGLFW